MATAIARSNSGSKANSGSNSGSKAKATAPRSAVALITAGALAHIAWLATLIGSASGTLLVTAALGPPIAAVAAYSLWVYLRGDEHAPSLLGLVQVRLGSTTGLVVVSLGFAYVVGTGTLMARVSYDIWGAFVVAPLIAWIGIRLGQKVFAGEYAELRTAAAAGLVAKAAGTIARYWVANSAYGGQADASSYHNNGKEFAGLLYDGKRSLAAMVPHSSGTKFVDELTGLLYALVGSSRLAGFLWFSLLGYVGVVFTVKAVCRAVSGLERKRYAWLCFLMPSLVFWPSSIGKEAWISLTFGVIAVGAARLLAGRVRSGLPWVLAGGGAAAMVRPHMALLGVGGLAFAALVAVVGRRVGPRAQVGRPAMFAISVVALVFLVLLGRATLEFLNPDEGTNNTSVVTSINDILSDTERRTSGGGSSFTPVNVRGPIDYPEAIVRTLTRPYFYEVRNVETLIPATEMTFYLGLLLVSWRRVVRAPRLVLESPFLVYATLTCVLFGLGWASFGNLAILVRQRSLVMPMMLVFPCLPLPTARPAFAVAVHDRLPRAPLFGASR